METTPGDGWAWLRLFEIERRSGNVPMAREALRRVRQRATPRSELLVAAELASGYLEWWTPEAEQHYRNVERLGRELGDPTSIGLGLIGQLRCSRFTMQHPRLELVDEARQLLQPDVSSSADLDREESAHEVMSGNKARALELAISAQRAHEQIGDRVLGAYALLLRGRIERDSDSDRFSMLRRAHAQAVECGARDVAADIALFLIPALSRGQSPGSPELTEALDLANELLAYKQAHDAFGAAELHVQLAGMMTLEAPEVAAEHADLALAYFRSIGNDIGVGSAYKALARIQVRRLQVVWQGSWLRGAIGAPLGVGRSLRTYGRARAAYVRARMPTAAARVSVERALVQSYELGKPIASHELRILRGRLSDSDNFTSSKLDLLEGFADLAERPLAAVQRFEDAAEGAEYVGSSNLASMAYVGLAAAQGRNGNATAAAGAARRFIDHAERVRGSILGGQSSLELAHIAREPYRFVLELAVEAADADLALQVLERIRAEKLAGLFARTGGSSARSRIDDVLDHLFESDRAIETCEAAGGAPSELDELLARRDDLIGELEQITNSYFATLYTAQPFDIDEIVDALDADEFVLLQELLGDETDVSIISVWRAPGGRWQVSRRELEESARRVLEQLTSAAGRQPITIGDLMPLVDLVPVELARQLANNPAPPSPLRIVPAGRLWSVPYLVVPIGEGDRVQRLVDVADITLTPSLRLLALRRQHPIEQVGTGVASWLSPELPLQRAELAAFNDVPLTTAASPAEFLAMMASGDHRIGIITSHGNNHPGLSHAATLGGRPVITAADLLSLTYIASTISIAACHGLIAAGSPDEPLGLTTAALCGGAGDVIGSHLELSTEAPTTIAMLQVYRRLVDGGDPSRSVSAVVRGLLRKQRDSSEVPVNLWGALNVASLTSRRQRDG